MRIPNRYLWRKPMIAVHHEVIHAGTKLARKLTFFDLLSINFGGAIGSGMFAIIGLIASQYAGPSGCLSWVIAGLGCSLSGLSYAELSGVIPSSGGAYAFTYVTLGELPALIVGWLITLEFGLGASAVARSWGDKVIAIWMVTRGIEASKKVVNVFSMLKVLLAVFMICTCLYMWDSDNLTPWAPFGGAGTIRASTLAFFAFLGFEEVCLLSLEAINPEVDVPLCVIVTLATSTIIYLVASLALCGVLPASDIDPTSGFSEAFFSRGIHWAGQVSAIGEVVVLPLVVVVSFMGQPRLMFSMAEDGLLPPLMMEVNASGGLANAAIISWAVCILGVILFDFSLLGECTSVGALLSFNATNSALLVMRCGEPGDERIPVNNCFSFCCSKWRKTYMELMDQGKSPVLNVLFLNISAIVCAVLLSFYKSPWKVVINIFAAPAVACFVYSLLKISQLCNSLTDSGSSDDEPCNLFRVPLVPWLPAMGTLLNYALVMQISRNGAIFMLLYTCTGVVWYFCYGVWNTGAASEQWIAVTTSEEEDEMTE